MKDEVCCHGECLQGRSCPYRETVTPKHLLPGPRREYTVEIAVAVAVTVIFGAYGLVWLWELAK